MSGLHPAASFRMIAPLLVFAWLGGCSLVPDYRRPEAPLAPHWDGALVATAPIADTVAVRNAWWRNYRDPALDALEEDSLRHNYSLAAAIATVEETRANAERAGAALYPSVTLGGTFDRSHAAGNTSNISSGLGSSSNKNSQTLFGEASYEVDFWGLNAANADAARLLARASEFDRDTVALTLTASVANTYFLVQALHSRAAIARTISSDAARTLAVLVAQQQAGVATELQVEQQRSALATFQAAVPVLQQQLEQSEHALATLTGVAPEQFAPSTVALEAIVIPQPRADLPATLLETRPDIRSKEAQLQSANYSVGAARAAFFPNLVLTADGGLSSSTLSHFLASPLTSVAASLAAPVFDGGALRGQLHANRAAVVKSVADYRQTVLTALQDVEDALSAAQQQKLAEQADQVATDAARKAAVLAAAQYQYGTIDFLTVLDTQRTAYQAEDTSVQVRLARLQASVGLFRAFGGGVELGNVDTTGISGNTTGTATAVPEATAADAAVANATVANAAGHPTVPASARISSTHTN
jgi:NodT family efflux transporter outer membrane factor (OMF) lipoprotein